MNTKVDYKSKGLRMNNSFLMQSKENPLRDIKNIIFFFFIEYIYVRKCLVQDYGVEIFDMVLKIQASSGER